MSKQSGIPVKHYGETIGTATIENDGTISMQLLGSQEFGVDLFAALNKGVVDGLSISPIFTTAEPKNRSKSSRYKK